MTSTMDEDDLAGEAASLNISNPWMSRYGTSEGDRAGEGEGEDAESFAGGFGDGINVEASMEESVVHRPSSVDSQGIPDPSEWKFSWYRRQGNMSIIGEWESNRNTYVRMLVFGPNILCVILTYVLIGVPPVMIYTYLIHNNTAGIILMASAALTLVLLTAVVVSDPGLVRAYDKARTNKWTYCDVPSCVAFRPPSCVHCTACDVCIRLHGHHCIWIGKCVGSGNKNKFNFFTVSLSWLLIVSLIVASFGL